MRIVGFDCLDLRVFVVVDRRVWRGGGRSQISQKNSTSFQNVFASSLLFRGGPTCVLHADIPRRSVFVLIAVTSSWDTYCLDNLIDLENRPRTQ